MMITYFIQSGEDGPIKIGKSTNVQRRLAALSTANPVPLRLLATLDGDQEAALHARLVAHRLSGEWFRPHDDVLAEVSKGTKPTLAHAPSLSVISEIFDEVEDEIDDDEMSAVDAEFFGIVSPEFLGPWLRSVREAAGLTSRQVAEAIGSTEPAISRLEAGENITWTRALKYLQACGYDVELIGKPAKTS